MHLIEPEDYPLHSRVHTLKLGKAYGVDCYIKREDELGCIVSGSKVRKYHTLIKALKNKNCQKVGLIGSQFSNHVLGLSTLLIENEIEPTLFLLQSKNKLAVGNALFINLLVPSTRINLISRQRWSDVEEIARSWEVKNKEFAAEIVSEGGNLAQSIRGLATLAIDIIENERELGVAFKEILIDAGTGLTASCLIATFGLLQKKCHIHVMLAASDPDSFSIRLEAAIQELERQTKRQITSLPSYSLHRPPTAQSFGGVNRKVFETIKTAMQHEGVFLEPIYSAKLYLLLEKLLQAKALQSPVLFIHSGGLFSLAGFQDSLREYLAK